MSRKMNDWLATPAVSVDWYGQREGAKRSGGRSGLTFDAAYEAVAPYFAPYTVSYQPVDARTLQSLLEASIRPAYDQAIARRRESTAAYNAALDADAWARGIGQSTYVTDVKQRNQRDEARDVDTLEASYGSTLAERLFAALSEQEERALDAEKFNAEQWNDAKSRMYSAASSMTRGSGSGGAQSKPVTAGKPVSIYRNLAMALNDGTVEADDPKPTREEARYYWSEITPEQRRELYNATDAQNGGIMRSIERAYGPWAIRELYEKYPMA